MSEDAVQKKQPYEAPALVVLGTLEDLTQGSNAKHNSLDANFGIGTPTSNLTFS